MDGFSVSINMSLAKQKTNCPQCNAVLSVKQELHGRNVKCPGCGTRFVLDLSVIRSKSSIFERGQDQFDTAESQRETLPFDAGTVESQHYLAIEYIAGQPLDKFANEQKIDHRPAAQLVAALARALSYAHGEGIVHRDIKPANIVLEADGTPKIVDFGLAKRLGDESNQTVDGTVLGTPAYMSPEQARGATSEIGPHSDQYSLGVVLYWLLTGQAPFIGPTIAVISQVINSAPMPPRKVAASIDPKLEAICLKSMAKVPASRYRNCLEFARDLDHYLNGEDVIAKPEGFPARVLRLAKRYPRQFALGIGFAILSTIALVTTVSGMARAYSLAAVASKAEKESEDRLAEQSELRKKSEAQLVLADAARTRSVEALRTTEVKKKEIEQVNQDLEASIAANVSKNAELKAKLNALDQSKSVTTKSEEVIREASAKSSQIAAEVTAIKETSDVKLKESAGLIKQGKWDSATQRLESVQEKDRKWQWYLLSKLARSNNKLVASKSIRLELDSHEHASAYFDWDDDIIHLLTGKEPTSRKAKSHTSANSKSLILSSKLTGSNVYESLRVEHALNKRIIFPEVDFPDFALEHLIEDPRDHKVFAWGHNSDKSRSAKDVGTLFEFDPNFVDRTGNDYAQLRKTRSWKKVWTTQNLPYVKDPNGQIIKLDPSDQDVLFATDAIVVTRVYFPSGSGGFEFNGRLIQPDDLALKERLMTHVLKNGYRPGYYKPLIEARPERREGVSKVVFTLTEILFSFELELNGLERKRLDDPNFAVFLTKDFSLIVLYGNVLARYDLK